jgi:hypothetical protein
MSEHSSTSVQKTSIGYTASMTAAVRAHESLREDRGTSIIVFIRYFYELFQHLNFHELMVYIMFKCNYRYTGFSPRLAPSYPLFRA